MNNHLQILTGLLADMEKDPRINVTHIAIFMALFRCWIVSGSGDLVSAFSYEIMPRAKLNSKNTYHRKLRELSSYGYLHYEPSRKFNIKSKIRFPIPLADVDF